MRTEFVYQPKSGDKVFSFAAMPGMAVIGWSNGCRHVVLDEHVPVLRYGSASRAWRAAAGKLVDGVVTQAGGIAWDVRGEITVICAPRVVWALATALSHMAGVTAGPWGVNPQLPELVGLELFQAGLSSVRVPSVGDTRDDLIGFTQKYLGDLVIPELIVGEPVRSEKPKPDGEEGETTRVTSVPVTDGKETVTVTSPWSVRAPGARRW